MEKDHSKVQIIPFQEKAAIRMCGVINEYLNMNVLALRGFWYNAVQAWQESSGRFLSDTMRAPLEDRLEVMKALFSHIEEALGRILRDPAQKKDLTEVFPKVLGFYKEVYGDRSYLELTKLGAPTDPKS